MIPKSKARNATAIATAANATARPGPRKSETPSRMGGRASDRQFEAVIGRDYLDLVAAAADPLVSHGIGEDDLDHPVVQDRFMMKQREPLDLCRLCQLNCDNIARMTPILLDRDRVAERIH